MKVSIITVVYNNVNTISECIQSVLDQDYDNIELIVIDGASTDGTQKKIEHFLNKLAYYISEKDSGIFDAYNKGVKNATGDIIGILNSDDFYPEKDVISEIVKTFTTTQSHIVYGKGIFVGQKNTNRIKRIYPSNPFKKSYLKFGWIPLHPTIYVKKELYDNFGLYSLEYSIASDYDISLRWFRNKNLKKYFLNKWIVKMRLGGKSTTIGLQKRKSSEDLKIIKEHKLMGFFTLIFKIGRKIPHYLAPQLKTYLNF
ncbi:glycosyltransferase family 2 protein [Christiangramia echinicola]|uniref:glycosyltransferase family 2 protein n=1 Tax=Christiangramia echinicola TaxID=279359 RepID=UPI00041B99D6|nr:glycosyltransferase family 2 protein [Christiangramia echinicola]